MVLLFFSFLFFPRYITWKFRTLYGGVSVHFYLSENRSFSTFRKNPSCQTWWYIYTKNFVTYGFPLYFSKYTQLVNTLWLWIFLKSNIIYSKKKKITSLNHIGKQRESWNSKMGLQWVNPQAQAQLNEVQNSKNCNWSRGHSLSSKVWLFLSFHTIYIKHNGVGFQRSE